MKQIVSLILTIMILLSLSACGEVESEMAICSYCSAEIEPMENYCQSCGKPLSSMRPDGYEEYEENDESEVRNGFEGVWCVEGPIDYVYSFLADGTFQVIELYDDLTVCDVISLQYTIIDGDTVVIAEDGEELAECTYELSDDDIRLSYDGELTEFFKVTDGNTWKDYVGRWCPLYEQSVFLCIDSDWLRSYDVKEFDFYVDQTYRLVIFPRHGEDTEIGGQYQIVHDGKAIMFDGNDYHNFELLGNNLMILTDQDGEQHLLVCVEPY